MYFLKWWYEKRSEDVISLGFDWISVWMGLTSNSVEENGRDAKVSINPLDN